MRLTRWAVLPKAHVQDQLGLPGGKLGQLANCSGAAYVALHLHLVRISFPARVMRSV